MIRNVKIVFSELPPKHIHETISEQKRSILLSSLANLEKISNEETRGMLRARKENCAGHCFCGLQIDEASLEFAHAQSLPSYWPNENKWDNHLHWPCLSLLDHEHEPHEVQDTKMPRFLSLRQHSLLMGQGIGVRELLRTKFDEEVVVHFCLAEQRCSKCSVAMNCGKD
jgi:hypothetical protein